MQKRMCWMLLLSCCLLLTACAAPDAPDTAVTETPPPIEAPHVEAQGPAAQAARAMLAPFDGQIEKIADSQVDNISYSIPGAMLDKMTQDAQELGIAPQNGRYQFTWRQSGTYTYSVSATDLQSEMEAQAEQAGASPTPENDAPRSDSYLGDETSSGGGVYDRVYTYDTAEDFSQGRIEILETLNGETSGHETFTFALRENALYFVDAAPYLDVDLDTLEISDQLLVAVGRLERNGAEIIEYLAPPSAVPQADTLDFAALAASVTPISHLTARGSQVTVTP